MNPFSFEKAVIEQVNFSNWKDSGVEVYVKREDLSDPIVSGNKWRKLKYNVEQFKLQGNKKLLTFGGAFSNHLHAVARVGELLNIPTVGIVRGERVPNLSETLLDCEKMGMDLQFVSREKYAEKEAKGFQQDLRDEHGDVFIIPEGGNNYRGVIGCQEILKGIPSDFTDVFCGLGTGTTFAGLISSGYEANFHGVAALKGSFHEKDVLDFINNNIGPVEDLVELEYVIFHNDFHFGGFAKWNEELISFIRKINSETGVQLDLIYNAKVWFALDQLISNGSIEKGAKVLLINTGGLQGNRGFKHRLGEDLFKE
jgi:1-aminocyclopropane-1-carboxylate deaminase/D-cysteine desulfhydrase-like pyridoxal-dependent ACC family enzyme